MVAHLESAHSNKPALFLPLTGTGVTLAFGFFRGEEGRNGRAVSLAGGFSFSILKFNHNQTVS